MRLGTQSIVALISVLGIVALCLSCGPREQSGNPDTAAATERDRAPAPPPPAEPAGDAVAAALDTTVPAATTAEAPPPESLGPADPTSAPTPSPPKKPAAIPRLVDLGADKCIPCKMMAPILEELKRDYAGQFDVEFVDVWKDPNPGRKYGIKVIPTQIFFDASGAERFRHEGFFGKEDILKKWAELGVTLRPPQG